MQDIVKWDFPIDSCHAGMMLGNATTGLEIWGGNSVIKITIGRADFWDHRGGMKWTAKQNYQDIKCCLENNDKTGLEDIFKSDTANVAGEPERPSIVPVGRLDLHLPDGAILSEGSIDLKNGKASIAYIRSKIKHTINIQLAMNSQIFCIELPEQNIKIKNLPSWKCLSEYFQSISIPEFESITDSDLSGWIQTLPNDPALCVGHIKKDTVIWGITERNENITALKESVIRNLTQRSESGIEALAAGNQKWWDSYWKDIPEISIPNDDLDFLYSYGLYKFAAFTNPSGTPATLQGPWIEDHKMPPWSSDYHFNINVQMCYWPAYKANRLTHLKPLFDMVWSWREQLRINAEYFVGIKDGYMLPHAVDDRSTSMGGFWTGVIDHACTAWIAQMMFQYFQYSGDKKFLESIAYPFMQGAMRVYEAMLEKEGDKYSLPVSVSPEYNGSGMNAWGENASFQLAAIHQLAEHLIEAAEIVNAPSSPVWKDILINLPKATFAGDDENKRIALWKDMDLEESHRHHSHMAAICPFDIIDIHSDEWNKIAANTLNHWTGKGMGMWSGWCMPWASMLHSRCGNGEMAELILSIWKKVFTNEGNGTLHDSNFGGFTLLGIGNLDTRQPSGVMQMDAGMGAIVAIQDMLLHSQRGVNYVLHAVPKEWKNVSFSKMPSEGGYMVSAEKTQGSIQHIKVESKFDGIFKLANPWPGHKLEVTFNDNRKLQFDSAVLKIEIPAKSSIEIKQVLH
jgi:alpha-L-fucosidase 2